MRVITHIIWGPPWASLVPTLSPILSIETHGGLGMHCKNPPGVSTCIVYDLRVLKVIRDVHRCSKIFCSSMVCLNHQDLGSSCRLLQFHKLLSSQVQLSANCLKSFWELAIYKVCIMKYISQIRYVGPF